MNTEDDHISLRVTVITGLRLALMAVCLGMLALPAVHMVHPIFEQKPLFGVLADTPCPDPTIFDLSTEKFQSGFTKCFEQRYGARPTATRLDNSVAYWAFDEMPPDKKVRVGTNGVLFMDDHVSFYNRHDEPDVVAMAAKVKRAQELLLARGKVFIFMIMPTKTSLWPDDVAKGWRREGSSPARPRAAITDRYVKALEAAGALFVDGRKSVASLPREAVYATTGRHLAAPGACAVFSDALALARPLVHDAEVPTIECNFRMAHGVSVEEEDFDLLRLMNIFTPPPSNAVPVMDPMTERTPRERRADGVVLGTSFGWKIVYEAERTHALRRVTYYYYNSRAIDRDTNKDSKVVPMSKEWQDLVASSTLFFYPAPEEYLLVDGEVFVDAVIGVYSAGGAAPGAVTP